MPEDKKDNLPQNTVSFDPIIFHNDEQIYLVYKKTEAIAGAIFLTTQGVSDTEVIKKNLREESLAALHKVVAIISKGTINILDLQTISASLTHISSLLDIAFWSGVISQMNTSLIQREIALIYRTTNNLIAKYKNDFYLDESFFRKSDTKVTTEAIQPIVKTPVPEVIPMGPKDVLYKGHDKGQSKGRVIKDIRPINNTTNNARRESIIALLRQGGAYGIKDVATLIPSVSEKTIQRELLALVAEGIARKEGERRWSTYSINT
jgi:hypothetical protein